MDLLAFFRYTFLDLEDRVERARAAMAAGTSAESEYHVIRSAALLRQLLIDARPEPLVEAVSRQCGRIVVYQVVGWPMAMGTVADARFGPGHRLPDDWSDRILESRDLSRLELMDAVVLIWNNYGITASDLIKYVAYVEGGVHRGIPRGDLSEALAEMSDKIYLPTHPLAQTGLLEIGRVVLKGLRPILRGETPVEPPVPDE